MSIIEILKQDYQRFPINQTYSIYADDVSFQDPLNKFRGIDRYKKMIQFIQQWFLNPKMDVHDIQQQENTIKTEWTFSWNTPLPWKPRISISMASYTYLLDSSSQYTWNIFFILSNFPTNCVIKTQAFPWRFFLVKNILLKEFF